MFIPMWAIYIHLSGMIVWGIIVAIYIVRENLQTAKKYGYTPRKLEPFDLVCISQYAIYFGWSWELSFPFAVSVWLMAYIIERRMR
jgi:hypothetical protein